MPTTSVSFKTECRGGSVSQKIVRHDGTVLVDELASAEYPPAYACS